MSMGCGSTVGGVSELSLSDSTCRRKKFSLLYMIILGCGKANLSLESLEILDFCEELEIGNGEEEGRDDCVKYQDL
jgi:hypothetical protein